MQSCRSRNSAFLSFALGLLPASGLCQESPRQELLLVEQALDRSVRKVSRGSGMLLMGGSESCRGYHIRGYGAVFVLPPRVLPASSRPSVFFFGRPSSPANLDEQIRVLEDAMTRAQSTKVRTQIRRSIEALKRTRDEQEGAGGPGAMGEAERELLAFQAQVDAFQREAEQASAQADEALARALEEASRNLRVGIDVPQPAAPPAPALAPPRAPPVPRAEIAPPPWRFWFETESGPGDERTPQRVIGDVRAAVTDAIEASGDGLSLVRPDEFIAVAVDFLPHGMFGPQTRPQRTLVVRVRKKELDDRRAGRIGPDEFRKRVEYVEY